jgi:hypothetical protein
MQHWFSSISTFENHGTLLKSVGAGQSQIDMIYNGDGVLQVQTGTLYLTQGGSNTSLCTLEEGTTLRLAGTHTFGAEGSMQGAGGVRASGGTASLNGTLGFTGPLGADGGTLNVNAPVTTPAAATISAGAINMNAPSSLGSVVGGPDGLLGGTGTVTIAGTMTMAGLNVSGGGEKTVQGLLAITGASDNNRLLGGARLRVAGGAVWEASSRILMAEGSRIVNEAGSVFDIRNAQAMQHWFSSISTFENHGTLLKSAGGTSQIDMNMVNDGIVAAGGGTLFFTQSYTQNDGETVVSNAVLQSTQTLNLNAGRLAGIGAVSGSANVRGVLEAGFSPGLLTISGACTLRTSATHRVEIGGLAAGAEHDRVDVGGAVSLGGALELAFVDGFAPSLDDTFAVMSWASRSGQFAATNVAGLADGLVAEVQYGATGLVVKVVAGSGSGAAPGTEEGTSAFYAISLPRGAGVAPDAAERGVTLNWRGEPGSRYTVDWAAELGSWKSLGVVGQEVEPGVYRAEAGVPSDAGRIYFRFRRMEEE